MAYEYQITRRVEFAETDMEGIMHFSNFFRFMESAAGEDLSWWWRGWYFNNWQLDLCITGASYVDNDPAKGIKVQLLSRQKLVMPATLRIAFADGSQRDIRVPVEAWRYGGTPSITIDSTQFAIRLTIDPDHTLPDADRSNNDFLLPARS